MVEGTQRSCGWIQVGQSWQKTLSKFVKKFLVFLTFLSSYTIVNSDIKLVACLVQCFYVFFYMVSQRVAQASLKVLSSGEFVSPALKWAEAESRCTLLNDLWAWCLIPMRSRKWQGG